MIHPSSHHHDMQGRDSDRLTAVLCPLSSQPHERGERKGEDEERVKTSHISALKALT
jgi:hypothetical protein